MQYIHIFLYVKYSGTHSEVSVFLTLLILKLKFIFYKQNINGTWILGPSGFAVTVQNQLFRNVGLGFLYDLHLWTTTYLTHSEFCHLSPFHHCFLVITGLLVSK